MEEMAISKFKATCLAVLERVRKTGEPVLVTRFGHPIAEIVAPGALVHRLDLFDGKEASPHAGLIGDDDQAVTAGIQPFHAFRCSRLKFQSRRVTQISAVDHQGAVAIQDHYLVRCIPPAHEPDEPVTRVTVSVVL